MLNRLSNTILDIFFPITCFFCHRPGSFLCTDCEQKRFKKYVKRYCHVCHGLLRFPGVYTHKFCQKRSALDGVFATYILNDDLKKYLAQIKYHFNQGMLKALRLPIKQTLSNRPFSYDHITFIPLHRFRQNWRGFNQAEDIAKTIDPRSTPLLKKNSTTSSQSLLSRSKRKNNVLNCFECLDLQLVKGKTILLCDDVYTTGSTMNSGALTLKRAGAEKVYGYSLAIDEMPADS